MKKAIDVKLLTRLREIHDSNRRDTEKEQKQLMKKDAPIQTDATGPAVINAPPVINEQQATSKSEVELAVTNGPPLTSQTVGSSGISNVQQTTSKTEDENLPTHQIEPGYIAKSAEFCEQVLADDGRFFQMSGKIVMVIPNKEKDGVVIVSLSTTTIQKHLSKLMWFIKKDQRGKKFMKCNPPTDICRMIYESEDYKFLPILSRLAYQPYLLPDGTIVDKPGYNPETGILGIFEKNKFNILATPTRQDADHAVKILMSLFRDFPFKSEIDLSVALSAILTAVTRQSYQLGPWFHFRATSSGSGKTELTYCVAAFATGDKPASFPFPRSEQESQSLLLPVLRGRPVVVIFDNCTEEIRSYNILCSSVTTEKVAGRPLHTSTTESVPTNTVVICNGNNVGPEKDMIRRVIVGDLESDHEISPDFNVLQTPSEIIYSDRAYYVSLALTIVRAFILAGSPMTDVKELNSFKEWSCRCRQPLLWLGLPDPVKNVFLNLGKDEAKEELGRFLHAWYAIFSSNPTILRTAIKEASEELIEAFSDITGNENKPNARKVGKWMGRNVGCPVDGLKLVKFSETGNVVKWMVVEKRVSSVLSV